MKFLILAACIVAACAIPGPAVVNTGHSAQFRSQDSLGNYAFGYNEDHATGGTFRRESGSPGIAQGSYGLRTIDGRVRVVNYVADGLGFRANIQTNEPGVDQDQDPASVLINKAAAIVAPYLSKVAVAGPAAPIAIQQSIEAPVVQQYDQTPIIEQAAVVQKYEPAPIVEQAPIVQQYEAPIAQRYEPAGIYEQKYESAAPVVQKYEQAPYVSQHYESAPVLSTYTTKTYAAPAPVLSSAPLGHYEVGSAHAYGTKGLPLAGPALLSARAPLSPVYAAKGLGGLGGLGGPQGLQGHQGYLIKK